VHHRRWGVVGRSAEAGPFANGYSPSQARLKRSSNQQPALSSFEAKVQLAFLLGIFNKETRDNLFAVNTLRNKFAHRLEIHTFGHSSLGALLKNLTVAERKHAPNDIYGSANRDPISPNSSKRERVLFVVNRLLYYFSLDSFTLRQNLICRRFDLSGAHRRIDTQNYWLRFPISGIPLRICAAASLQHLGRNLYLAG